MADEFTFGGDAAETSDTFPNADGTILDKLRARLAEEIANPDIEIEVPMREGMTVRFSPNIKQADLNEWRNRSGAKRKEGLDLIKFSCYVIGNTATGIYLDGELIENDEGYALNFASSEILSMLDEERPIPEGIQAFFVNDAHLQSVAIEIMDRAGWGGEEIESNPTTG